VIQLFLEKNIFCWEFWSCTFIGR